jgi:hypothetical protein
MVNPVVINWEEALQQCGDDEEFLHELLADFRSELETQLVSIAATIQVRIECRTDIGSETTVCRCS